MVLGSDPGGISPAATVAQRPAAARPRRRRSSPCPPRRRDRRPVDAPGGGALAIGAERQAFGPGGVAADGKDFLAGLRVPELDRIVICGRGEPRTVGAERDFLDDADVAAEDEDLCAGLCVPTL